MLIKFIYKVFIPMLMLTSTCFSSTISICQGCHGKNFQQRALGKSKIVSNMKKDDIIKKLVYFKTSESIMKSYASRLNNKQIEQIANVFGQ